MVEISVRHVSKSFAGFLALQDVSLCLRGGEVHALMGENGAGKSTLIKVLAGVVAPDSLELTIDGERKGLASTNDAKALGFQFIHQELNIVPHLSVAENISLAAPLPKRLGLFVKWNTLRERAQAALSRLGVNHIDVGVQAARLSTGDQMLMRIAGSLVEGHDQTEPCLYVFDEPTAAMSGDDAERLFKVIDSLRQRGKAVLYVSHRMNEVMQMADRVNVLRDGRLVTSQPISETSREDLIFAMTGRDMTQAHPDKVSSPHSGKSNTNVVCGTKNLTTQSLRQISFSLHSGEILGVAGLANSGQSDLLQTVFGLQTIVHGTVSFNGSAAPHNTATAWQAHMAYVPKERRREALMLNRSIRDNIAVAQLTSLSSPLGMMSRKSENERCLNLAEAVGLKYQSLGQPVYQLSGGNQQKVVFARAISVEPKLLLLDEPTRGVDVGAKFEIYSLLRDLTAKGCAILLTSTDLPELIGMCDRILILQGGVQSEIVEAKGLQPSQLLQKFYSNPPEQSLAV